MKDIAMKCPNCGNNQLLGNSFKLKEEPEGYKTYYMNCERCRADFDAIVKVLELPFAIVYDDDVTPMLQGEAGQIVGAMGEACNYMSSLIDGIIDKETFKECDNLDENVQGLCGYFGDVHVVVGDFAKAQGIELEGGFDDIECEVYKAFCVKIRD